MDKILQFKQQGRTLLFVSHSTGAVQKLCERALWLNRGELVMDGSNAEVTAAPRAFKVGEPLKYQDPFAHNPPRHLDVP